MGPRKITLCDLWALLEPTDILLEDLANIKGKRRRFSSGWLCDTVRLKSYASFDPNWGCFRLVFLETKRWNIFNDVFFFQKVIDGHLRDLQREHPHVLASGSYLSEVVKRATSTRRTWNDVHLSRVKLSLFPVNFPGNYWTLFVRDVGWLCTLRRSWGDKNLFPHTTGYRQTVRHENLPLFRPSWK